MIIQIDDQYFNPLMITRMYYSDSLVLVCFPDASLYFKNWRLNDLAAEINRCIEAFNNGKV